MSVSLQIERTLQGRLSEALGGATVAIGPVTQPRVEGYERGGSVRVLDGTAEVSETFNVPILTERYAITAWWVSRIDRDTVLTEWEAFEAKCLESPWLGAFDEINGLQDSYLVETNWNEAADSNWMTMTAVLEAVRVDVGPFAGGGPTTISYKPGERFGG